MVRRVGFGEDEKEEQPHKAHVGRRGRIFGIMPRVEHARAEKQRTRATIQDPFGSGKRSPENVPDIATIVAKIRRIVFLFFWLLGWGAALMMSLGIFINSTGLVAALLIGWMGFASIAWLVTAGKFLLALFGLLSGRRTAPK